MGGFWVVQSDTLPSDVSSVHDPPATQEATMRTIALALALTLGVSAAAEAGGRWHRHHRHHRVVVPFAQLYPGAVAYQLSPLTNVYDQDAADARDEEWVAVCQPTLHPDQHGVMRYSYAPACPNGVPN
jgi:hypothetical protein